MPAYGGDEARVGLVAALGDDGDGPARDLYADAGAVARDELIAPVGGDTTEFRLGEGFETRRALEVSLEAIGDRETAAVKVEPEGSAQGDLIKAGARFTAAAFVENEGLPRGDAIG